MLALQNSFHPSTDGTSFLTWTSEIASNGLRLPLKSCPTATRMMFQRCEFGSVSLPLKSSWLPSVLRIHPRIIVVTQISSRRVRWTLAHTTMLTLGLPRGFQCWFEMFETAGIQSSLPTKLVVSPRATYTTASPWAFEHLIAANRELFRHFSPPSPNCPLFCFESQLGCHFLNPKTLLLESSLMSASLSLPAKL